MSIATKKGDDGDTGLIGGERVSKGSLRVEAYGSLDELGSIMGFARALCDHEAVSSATKAIQTELFHVSASLATPAGVGPGPKGEPPARVSREMVDRLTEQVEAIEALDGIFADWVVPGENASSAAYDMARACCRRAERVAVRLRDQGDSVDPMAIAYINRLSDLLWLFARLIEKQLGLNAKLRGGGDSGPNWSRAW